MSKSKNKLEHLNEAETKEYIDGLLEKAKIAREQLEARLKESEQKSVA